MRFSTKKDERGIAHIILIIIIVVVLAAIGGVGYYVYNKHKNGTASTPEQAAALATCKVNDKNICKFVTSWKSNKYFTAAITETQGSTKTSMVMQVELAGNFHLTSSGSTPLEMISIGSTSYVKDFTDNAWFKTTSSSSTASEISNSFNSKDMDITNAAIGNVYKKIGTEACGVLKCFKYQYLDPSQTGATEYIWFDNKDFQMRRIQTVVGTTTTDGVFTYDKFTITAPTPVKEMPTTTDLLNSSVTIPTQ